MEFAVIKDNVVDNVVVCESIELATELFGDICIPLTEDDAPHIGLTYKADTGFEQPVISIPTGIEETE